MLPKNEKREKIKDKYRLSEIVIMERKKRKSKGIKNGLILKCVYILVYLEALNLI